MTDPSTPAGTPGVRHIFRWDLDKTYLRTEFDTWIDLVRTAMERPERKRTVPGAAALLRELRATGPVQVTILSGSPEQMRASLESKLRLDGVQWDEFLLKSSWRNILRGRFRALRDQVGYKLPALLGARVRVPDDVPETLFGDDAEADAFVYSLYADILSGKITDEALTAVMARSGTYPDVIAETLRLVHAVGRTDPVRRIFIHLDRRSEPSFFARYGARVVPVYNYFQAAAVLVGDGVLDPVGALRVAAVLAVESEFSVDDLVASAHDLVTRGHAAPAALARIGAAARAVEEPFPLTGLKRESLAVGLDACPPANPIAPVAVIDYLAALTVDKERWEAAARAHARRGEQ